MRKKDIAKKILITGSSVIVGAAIAELAKSKWRDVYDEEPPTRKTSDEVELKKVILWSLLTGTVISSAKLATERYLTLKLES